MPVRVYGGFSEGDGVLRSVIYRVAKGQYRIAMLENKKVRVDEVTGRIIYPITGDIVVQEYPHWTAAYKWWGEFFRKPVQVKDEQTAWRFLKEPLIRSVNWETIELAPDLPEDFEYQWVEFDEDDSPR